MPQQLRFLIAWGVYSKGAVIEPTGVTRQNLLRTRFMGKPIVAVVDPEPAPEPKPNPEPPPEPDPEPPPQPETVPAGHDRKRKRYPS